MYTIAPILRYSMPQTVQPCKAGALIGKSSNLESDEPLNWSELSEAMIVVLLIGFC